MRRLHALPAAARAPADRRLAQLPAGAGVSAESGIPTFRGSAGLWRSHDPRQLATPSAFVRSPSLVWEFYHWRRDVAAACRPNRAHYALAALEARLAAEGHRLTLISQNVDRLHQAAGSRSVIELHGRWVGRCGAAGAAPASPAQGGTRAASVCAPPNPLPAPGLPRCSIWDVCVAGRGGQKASPCWEDRTQPLCPALAGRGAPADHAAPDIPTPQLPHDARSRLLRPGVQCTVLQQLNSSWHACLPPRVPASSALPPPLPRRRGVV